MTYLVDRISFERRHEGQLLANGEVWISRLAEKESKEITEEHSSVLVKCYIDPANLRKLSSDNGLQPGDFLIGHILPDAAHMKSADSGEILARGILQEWGDEPQFPAYRWRHRANKNDTVRGADLIGYTMQDPEMPDGDDLLVIAEVKTRSKTVDADVVEEAFNHAKKHYASRLAHSLITLQHWLVQQGDDDQATRLARFSNPHAAPFRKRLVPCVVHTAETWNDSFLLVLPAQHELEDEVQVLIVCVEKLPDWIDAVFKAAAESVA